MALHQTITESDGESPFPGVSIRHLEIFRRYMVDGLSQRQVAEEFGITQPGVCKIVKRVKPVYFRDVNNERADWRTIALERSDLVFREAMQEWFASKQSQLASTTETSSDKQGSSVSRTTTGEIGNLQALQIALKANQHTREIAGTDAAQELNVNTETTVNVNLQSMQPDERHTLADAARVLEGEFTRRPQRIEQTDS